jgi:misacylated tRNA(Ala) deacylase
MYLTDEEALGGEAAALELRDGALALDRSWFYPGGGGQPSDSGALVLADGSAHRITEVRADADGVLWHAATPELPSAVVGTRVRVSVDAPRRRAFARYHTVLHVLNTIVLRDHGGWITGAQIAETYARIDFKLEAIGVELRAELEEKVNRVLSEEHPIVAYYVAEEEFAQRKDLLRTLDARPPVVDGRVRVVEIRGFDAQACGGTHVRSSSEVGRFSITKTENKGKINKRLYVRLGDQ